LAQEFIKIHFTETCQKEKSLRVIIFQSKLKQTNKTSTVLQETNNLI